MNASFWKQTLERAVKTAAQALLALWIVGDGMLDAFSIDWAEAAGIAGGAAIISVLTSLVSAPVGPADTPSLVK